MSKIRITCVIVDRANYGRLLPLLELMEQDYQIDLKIICCGSTVLKRFHEPHKDISLLFNVTHRLYHEVEGSNYLSIVQTMSNLMPQLALALQNNEPDFVMIIGDRFEALAVATTCHMMRYCIIHLQGGECSGNVDDTIRHSITKLSHYHIPATTDAYDYLKNKLNEDSKRILAVGCPSADLASRAYIDVNYKNYVLCVYHPETGINNHRVVEQLLRQLEKLKKNVLMLWPNIDPGSDDINKIIRRFINAKKPKWLHMLVNIDPCQYLSILKSVSCCVGNSSSFVRDASFFGTPVILIGNRQIGRIRTANIRWFKDYDLSNLYMEIIKELGKIYSATSYYGKQGICQDIVSAIKQIKPYSLKVNYG